MKIRWFKHYTLTKRKGIGIYILFHYSEGFSEIDLKCRSCSKSSKARIRKVKSERGHLHYSKICPKCRVSFPLSIQEKKKLL